MYFTIKVNSTCGAGRDAINLCHKLNSQDPTLRILGLSLASPKSQRPSSKVLSVRVSCLRVPESRVPGLRDSGFENLQSQGYGSQGLGSRVSGPNFKLFQDKAHSTCWIMFICRRLTSCFKSVSVFTQIVLTTSSLKLMQSYS